ncbi:MAG: hypothetical protein ACRDTH_09430 [Pseudonocardiaceae bacterium]
MPADSIPTRWFVSTNGAWPASGVITADGRVEVNGTAYYAPNAAAGAVKNGHATAGILGRQRAHRRGTLATLRTRYLD